MCQPKTGKRDQYPVPTLKFIAPERSRLSSHHLVGKHNLWGRSPSPGFGVSLLAFSKSVDRSEKRAFQ
jgi:hypothetical protein